MEYLPIHTVKVVSAKNTWVQPQIIENVILVEYTLKGIILITVDPDTRQINGFHTFASLEYSWEFEVLENA